jgi:hypothetical protein
MKTKCFRIHSLNCSQASPIFLSSKAAVANGIQRAERRPGKPGEVVMTQFNHVPAQSSRFNQYVVSAFMGTMLVLAGLLSFAPYSLI